MRVLVVDDDVNHAKFVRLLLERAGHKVEVRNSPLVALADAPGLAPECMLLDLMMPEMDGMELCSKLRQIPSLQEAKIIIVSSKAYDSDRHRAMELGADGYITKPIDPQLFAHEVERLVSNRITLTYWGVHGTLPVTGRRALRYGGNTPCITVEAPEQPLLIFDAGTGIKSLSDHLSSASAGRITAKLIISHPHWDHVNTVPFFAPLYQQGNEIEIMGPRQGDLSVRQLISLQMDRIFFPITIREFGARVDFRDLREEEFTVGKFTIQTMMLSHPGACLGYRVTYKGRSVCYVTDNEMYPQDTAHYNPQYLEKLSEFVSAADILITDCTFLDEEYPAHVGWGHSCTREVATLAARAAVKRLHLFHHDPDQDDDRIDAKLEEARKHLADVNATAVCECPAEGAQFVLASAA